MLLAILLFDVFTSDAYNNWRTRQMLLKEEARIEKEQRAREKKEEEERREVERIQREAAILREKLAKLEKRPRPLSLPLPSHLHIPLTNMQAEMPPLASEEGSQGGSQEGVYWHPIPPYPKIFHVDRVDRVD